MILKEIFYAVKCNRCGAINQETDTAFWHDESTAENQANDDEWLCNVPGEHYCPNCFTVNEETDEITIKHPFPESVKCIEKFIDMIPEIALRFTKKMIVSRLIFMKGSCCTKPTEIGL